MGKLFKSGIFCERLYCIFMNSQSYYKSIVVNQLLKEFKYRSSMQVPNFEKITLNMGLGESASDKKLLNDAVSDLSLISGQKPIFTKVRKSVSNFKIRKGFPIGCKVTLRSKRMWEFFDRLIFIAIPRIRDFRGFSSKSFDGYGNYNIGVCEQIIFPEIRYDKVGCIRGMDIAITTTAKSNREGYFLLKLLNFPFRNN
ncbi:MAG: 50S ribosomal subunit protein L5 [Candidatus Westeberhardia cardiocondylae]|nr:50S ribosomal subunit protein L5 [Candidatus Westeberhardia cardiocondylae]